MQFKSNCVIHKIDRIALANIIHIIGMDEREVDFNVLDLNDSTMQRCGI